MFDPFAHYDIKWLSPSACNRFMSSPALYLQEYVFKKRTGVGASAHRGTAAEAGIVDVLVNGKSVEEGQVKALTEFDRLTAFMSDPRRDKEREAVPQIVAQGVKELIGYGKPTSTQGEMFLPIEGVMVPMKGYYDFIWEDKGVLTDLKTTLALPSRISSNHAKQVAFYNAAHPNFSARVSYVTPKKSATYELENASAHWAALQKCAQTIQRFLSLSKDKEELASLVVPDVESFYYNDPASRQIAFEIWGV